MNPVQQRLRDGQPVIAVNLGGRNPDVMPSLASAGAHVAFIDCERTGLGLDAATDMIRAARLAGLAALVRTHTKEPAVLVQYLDRQVDGLVIPHINTAQDAADVVELVRYACGAQASQKTVIVQIETREAVASLDAIMAVPGVDAYLVGPNDLAYSMIGQRSAKTPEVIATVEDVCRRLQAAGKRFGMPARLDELETFQRSGATFLYYPIEWLLDRAVKEVARGLKLTG